LRAIGRLRDAEGIRRMPDLNRLVKLRLIGRFKKSSEARANFSVGGGEVSRRGVVVASLVTFDQRGGSGDAVHHASGERVVQTEVLIVLSIRVELSC
jgi:hypothetical protein